MKSGCRDLGCWCECEASHESDHVVCGESERTRAVYCLCCILSCVLGPEKRLSFICFLAGGCGVVSARFLLG